jgi:hypothetical protein
MTFGKVITDLLPYAAASEVEGRMVLNAVFWIVGLFIAVFVSIDIDRYHSWIRDNRGQPTDKKQLFIGVVVPDIVSMIIFGACQTGGLG